MKEWKGKFGPEAWSLLEPYAGGAGLTGHGTGGSDAAGSSREAGLTKQ
jgi:hypothetical protein